MLQNSSLDNYEFFITAFKKKSGLDLKAYKQNQMERRIRTFMATKGYNTFNAFIKALETDAILYDGFFKHLTINVSQFFRDPNQWKSFNDLVVPKILQSKKHLKLWSAGCSSGQEPYTMAINLLENFPNIKFNILASDIDENVLKQAREGFYKQLDFVTTPANILSKYFSPTSGGFRINDNVKHFIKFEKQNLLTDRFEKDFNLIACRNVVIYFTEETKEILYRKFLNSLLPGGVLFSGSSEHLLGISNLGLKSIASFFYQKATS